MRRVEVSILMRGRWTDKLQLILGSLLEEQQKIWRSGRYRSQLALGDEDRFGSNLLEAPPSVVGYK
jgi:hypothetical protein